MTKFSRCLTKDKEKEERGESIDHDNEDGVHVLI